MHCFIDSWKNTLNKLGLIRKAISKRRPASHSKQVLRMERLECREMLAIVVDRFVDERDLSILDGDVSLRDAIERAPANETIRFSTDPAHGLNGATIALRPDLREIAFSKNLTIDASMLSAGITISAGHGTDQTPEQWR
jgi:hypothetical protein